MSPAAGDHGGGIPGRFVPIERGDRRVVVLDSATHTHRHVSTDDHRPGAEVIVNASYAGVYCAQLLRAARPAGVVGVDCGIGKDGAGIAGLWYFEALGVPAAAADIATVELGNGRDLYDNGVVSRLNGPAEALGVAAGMAVAVAAEVMAAWAGGAPPADTERRLVVEEGAHGRAVVCTNSIADARPEDHWTNVLCTAGHTGRSVVDYIVGSRPFGFICSDGGGGKHDSGLSALPFADEAGIPGAAVSAASARMGDGRSTYFDGVISAVNDLAAAAGVEVGQTARVAASKLLHRVGEGEP